METNNVKRGFASDNNAGVHPEVLKEIAAVNIGHVTGYGSDIYTEKAKEILRKHLGEMAEIFFVFNGTGANVLGLSCVSRSWDSVITAFSAHIEQDECGAPEKFIGCKVLTVDTIDGKLTADLVEKHMHGIDFEHHSQPRVISITQATEMGTIYSVDEIQKISSFAHENKMLLHMDGARLANAAVSLGLPFKAFTTDAGVDILSFGGTKNGMMFGEAVCFLRQGLAANFKYIRKQGMQLASKMRFISAQYLAYFNNDLWKKCASHSNSMAGLLYEKVKNIEGLRVTQPVQSNGVFVIIPHSVAKKLMESFFFYPWNEKTSEYRWMTSWDTTEEDINHFVDLIEKELKRSDMS
jgi:threonine aldolase